KGMAFILVNTPILMVVYVEINVISKKDVTFIRKDDFIFLVVNVVHQRFLLMKSTSILNSNRSDRPREQRRIPNLETYTSDQILWESQFTSHLSHPIIHDDEERFI
ncbi:13629_t:CDS:2, partial [Funneliformis mosseae]